MRARFPVHLMLLNLNILIIYGCLFVFLALQPIVVIFQSPAAGFSLLVFEAS
jgi:hypothetical protein